jgi:hypothetical protein
LTMRAVHPPELVTVARDGQWHDGELRAWRGEPDGWKGFACYALSPRIRHLEWVAAE